MAPLTRLFDLIRRGWNMSPLVIGRWLMRKLKARRAAKALPGWERWLGPSSMTAALNHKSFVDLTTAMGGANPFPGLRRPNAIGAALSDRQRAEVLDRAARAMRREVDMLGSGTVRLTEPINWHSDFKTATQWPMNPSLRLRVNNLANPSDIKVPWELSRLQWLLPVGQAYVLDGGNERAQFARTIIEEWMAANPVCQGPNWFCAMDVALRAIAICWLFQAFKDNPLWRDTDFLERLVKLLILHGRFIETNLEFADVNGNHLTSDLAGLTVIGVALGGAGIARRWLDLSWRLLSQELPLQVPADGVCREGSLPYHRLVAELFLLPALARRNVGLPVETAYLQRLTAMAAVTRAATRPDGEIPIWGDADDGRVLPLGTQALNDHRYLVETLTSMNTPPKSPACDETLWWLGTGDGGPVDLSAPASSAFADSGAYILRGDDDYIFIDAGPVGMDGRGGHGHNDCLSLEASLEGVRLIVDPGCYVYTADWQARNRFRSTAAHNTPQINGVEINRIPRADWLWYLANDAVPEIRHWSTSADIDLLVAAHSGYGWLASPVTPVRAVMLEKSTHRLFIADGFSGDGEHSVRIPFTFAPGISVEPVTDGVWRLKGGDASFLLVISSPDDWHSALMSAEYSPSYGVKVPVSGLAVERQGSLRPLALALVPERTAPPDPVRWLAGVVDKRFPVPGLGA